MRDKERDRRRLKWINPRTFGANLKIEKEIYHHPKWQLEIIKNAQFDEKKMLFKLGELYNTENRFQKFIFRLEYKDKSLVPRQLEEKRDSIDIELWNGNGKIILPEAEHHPKRIDERHFEIILRNRVLSSSPKVFEAICFINRKRIKLKIGGKEQVKGEVSFTIGAVLVDSKE